MRLVASWTSLTLCLIPAVYAAPVGETHPQVPRTSLSKRILSSRASGGDIYVRVGDGQERYPDDIHKNIEALVKAAAEHWGEVIN
ncbi:hypothetical protein LENED_006718 [Lentinula edodes]|uniref:Uncharacterized protein n=1 Tax=Lentinula edodes TaxID=5353 RepID=A0A1Q3ECK4_LENED|nr:hypothetical protein LENED_006718 [Lentinula edodes]